MILVIEGIVLTYMPKQTGKPIGRDYRATIRIVGQFVRFGDEKYCEWGSHSRSQILSRPRLGSTMEAPPSAHDNFIPFCHIIIARYYYGGLTQQGLADTIGAHRVTIADWVRGASKPRGLYLRALKELAVKPKTKLRR